MTGLDLEKIEFDIDRKELPPVPDDPRIIDGFLKNALLLIDNGDYDSALLILGHMLERKSDCIEALKWAGYCRTQKGELHKSLLAYEEMVRLNPGEESWFELGTTLYNLGQNEESIECYQQALSYIDYESPFLFEIYKNMGNISLRTGDPDGAEEMYNRAYTIHPHSDILLVNYGTMELQRGHLEEAKERFQTAIDLNSTNERAWLGLALIHREKGDFELSWGTLERVFDFNPESVIGLRAGVEWAFTDGRFDSVIPRLVNYCSKYPADFDMSYSLAGLLVQSGRLLQARDTLAAILHRNSENENARELLVIVEKRIQGTGNA